MCRLLEAHDVGTAERPRVPAHHQRQAAARG
jgi:hypothetical protein